MALAQTRSKGRGVVVGDTWGKEEPRPGEGEAGGGEKREWTLKTQPGRDRGCRRGSGVAPDPALPRVPCESIRFCGEFKV